MATMEQELTEYGAIQIAIERIEDQPTTMQRIMAVLPMLVIMFCSTVILYYSYVARGNANSEKWAPSIATILSVVMLIFEVMLIAYRHHVQYQLIRSTGEIIVRINIFHLIVCSSCIGYVKIGNNYDTYFTLVCITTVPIYLLSFCPFLCGVYTRNYS
jgi:hypothetical protein